ncbi:MAG: thioesterase family protein [Chloroflexota bacterium]|nr:acyl-CoA thioesterase [Dehalococcoidia bacterium]MDW8254721.1 thioesterase family protein [Chloroflexota bacterium]
MRPFTVELAIAVRGYDIDFAGIVSNIVYIRWLEDLRMALLAAYFPFSECVRLGVTPIILHTSIDYRHAVRMFDPLVGRIWVTAMGKTRWEIAAEFVVDERVMASAVQRGCFVSLSTGRPTPIPVGLLGPWREWERTGQLPALWNSTTGDRPASGQQ